MKQLFHLTIRFDVSRYSFACSLLTLIFWRKDVCSTLLTLLNSIFYTLFTLLFPLFSSLFLSLFFSH